MRTDGPPGTVSLNENVGVLIATRHRPAFITAAESRSSGYDCCIVINRDVDVVALGAFEINLARFDGGEGFSFVSAGFIVGWRR